MDENPSGVIDYKFCPLLMSGCRASGGITLNDMYLCPGSRCAWWDADKSRCAVLSLAHNK